MSKAVMVIALMATVLMASPEKDLTDGVKLINECHQLKNIKYKLGIFNFYGNPNRLSYGLSYGFKNDSNKTIKVKVQMNFKDLHNNTIADIQSNLKIKPHYSEPFNTGSYTAKDLSEVGDDFSGLTELIFNCKTTTPKIENKFKSINIPTKLWNKFAEKNGGDLMARLKLFEIMVKSLKYYSTKK